MGSRESTLPASHQKAVQAVGLPLFLLGDEAEPTYRQAEIWLTPRDRGYEVEYWQWGEPVMQLHVRCATRKREAPTAVKVLERRKAVVPAFGAVTLERYKGGCRTAWAPAGRAFVQAETDEELPLDRFAQMLESCRKTPAVPARGSTRLPALQAAGLPDLHLPGYEPSLEVFSLNGAREWHNRQVEYDSPPFNLLMSRGGIGDVGVGYQHPSTAEQVVQLPAVGKVYAYQATRRGLKPRLECYSEWAKVGKGYFCADSRVGFGRFVALLQQLRVR